MCDTSKSNELLAFKSLCDDESADVKISLCISFVLMSSDVKVTQNLVVNKTDDNMSVSLPSRQSDVETTSKQRQNMSSNRRRKRVENANGIDFENSTSFQRLEIDVRLSTSLRCYIFDVVSTSKKSWKRKRKRRWEFDAVSTYRNRRRIVDVASALHFRRRINVEEQVKMQIESTLKRRRPFNMHVKVSTLIRRRTLR